jgi:zinc-binding in reverse transcriptase
MWLVRKYKILTKDNLVRRGWSGNISCAFCGAYENINHLLVNCSLAFTSWNWIAHYNFFSF